jgi:hypothetical protein
MKKITGLFLSVLTCFSITSQAQVVNDLQLQDHLTRNSKLYQAFSRHSQTQHMASEILDAISYRLQNSKVIAAEDDLVQSKGLLFCAEVGAGMILVKGKLYACEVFNITGSTIGKNNFLWAYSFDFKLKSKKSKVLDTFENLIKNEKSFLKLDELFLLSGTVGMAVGYVWGDDYFQYDHLTLKKGFLATQFQVVNGWGAGLKILKPNQSKEKINMVLGSILYGDESTQIGSQVVIKFRKSIMLKSMMN